MKIFQVNTEHPDKNIASYVARQLQEGKVIIYPTDTVYGIGCSINHLEAVSRIYEIKGRDRSKPLSVAFINLEEAKKYITINEKEELFIKKHLNKPITFITRKKENIPDIVTGGRDTVGFRIISLPLVKQILEELKEPITTTSANISGEKPPASFNEISKEVLEKVDIALDAGTCRIGKPSTIVNLLTGEILRQSL